MRLSVVLNHAYSALKGYLTVSVNPRTHTAVDIHPTGLTERHNQQDDYHRLSKPRLQRHRSPVQIFLRRFRRDAWGQDEIHRGRYIAKVVGLGDRKEHHFHRGHLSL